jgi:hypothetical protein
LWQGPNQQANSFSNLNQQTHETPVILFKSVNPSYKPQGQQKRAASIRSGFNGRIAIYGKPL